MLDRPFSYFPKKCVPCMSKPSSRILVAPSLFAHSSASTPLFVDPVTRAFLTYSTPVMIQGENFLPGSASASR